MFKAINAVIESLTSTMVSISNLMQKSVGLAENEVDNLAAYQDLRMEGHKQDLKLKRNEFEKALEAS